MKNQKSAAPAVLPLTGKSRWKQIEPFCPFSRETFRKLYNEGKAPSPERLGIRCTFFDNAELHRWLADPVRYRVNQPTPISTPVDTNEIALVQEEAISERVRKQKTRDEALKTDGKEGE
jgi:prophage regulatory protein